MIIGCKVLNSFKICYCVIWKNDTLENFHLRMALMFTDVPTGNEL